jgi:hypothetical protein
MDNYKCPRCGRTCSAEEDGECVPPFKTQDVVLLLFLLAASLVISISGIWSILNWIF